MASNWFKKKTGKDTGIPEGKSDGMEPEKSRAELQHAAIPEKSGLFSRLKRGLTKTRQILTTDIDELFGAKNEIDDDMLEELEELLITSDIGVQTAMDLMQTIHKRAPRIKTPLALGGSGSDTPESPL